MEDLEGNVLRNDFWGFRLWKGYGYGVASVDLSLRSSLGTIDQNVPLLEESLYAGP